MSIAVLVVGSHYSGKSRTINHFLKPKLGIGNNIRIRKFTINGKQGIIWAQSPEESDRDIKYLLEICFRYEIVVIPCRPPNETPSYYTTLVDGLKSRRFRISVVQLVRTGSEQYHREKGKEIYDLINNIYE